MELYIMHEAAATTSINDVHYVTQGHLCNMNTIIKDPESYFINHSNRKFQTVSLTLPACVHYVYTVFVIILGVLK